VSETARRVGAKQLGTLGGGEHFIEISVVKEVFNRAAALTMGLRKGRLAAQIHCGSRAYGRQVCADYIAHFKEEAPSHGITPPNPNLACVPLESPVAERYMGAMRAAANYAYANRQVLTHRVREVFDEALDGAGRKLKTVYDVAHNLGQIEMHQVEDKHMRCYVHRKGAARAFGPGTPGISLPYRALGQPVVIPGSVGEDSWVLLATRESMKKSFGSVCHGSGRTMSRHEANHHAGEVALDESMQSDGIRVRTSDARASGGVQLKENIDAVVDTITGANVASRVARLEPLIVLHA
jgi:tRNA-splicing ligase RtcB